MRQHAKYVTLALMCTIAPMACSERPDNTPATMLVNARLVERPSDDPEGGGPAELVMAQISISNGTGQVMSAPRVCAEVGKPATLRVDANGTWFKVEVLAERDGDVVRVEADLSGSDGTPLLTVKTQAVEGPGEVSRGSKAVDRP